MKKLLEFIISSIIDNPESLKVTESTVNDEVNFSIKVAPSDMGKIIGKNGQIIKAIRTLLRTRAFKEGKKVQVILEEASQEK